jgi:cytidine deaminase
MYHAYGAAMRSADLSRQVGAAIVDDDGEVVALGCNEVPKGGGGLYWEDAEDLEDGRDFTFGRDTSSDIKRAAVAQLYERLRRANLLGAGTTVDQVSEEIQGIDLMNTGEFGRAVHAEMAAISHAARRGRSVQGCRLYTTTFPCQVCARHILAAGIKTVVYNEPYPKSLARYLHSDSILMGREGDGQTVGFIPFDGVASPLYADLFRSPSSTWRKTEEGEIPHWNKATATPRRYGHPYLYVAHEAYALKSLVDALQPKGLGI